MHYLDKFINNVIQWSKDRNIINEKRTEEQAKVIYDGQVKKHVEELNEVFTAITKKDKEGIKDGIGDVAVTHINTLITGSLYQNSGEFFSLSELLIAYVPLAIKLLNGSEETPVELTNTIPESTIAILAFSSPEMYFGCLSALARKYDLTLEECLDAAWNQIKDRKGYLSDEGIFVKESV